MSDQSKGGLTERQIAVAEGLIQHKSLKEIANDLAISESAINKHIQALKRSLNARTHSGIVAAYRAIYRQFDELEGYRKPSCSFSHLSESTVFRPQPSSSDPGLIAFADGADFSLRNDWQNVFEPRIVPRWLDGEHAVIARLAAVFALLMLMLVLPVLSVAALDSLNEIVGHKTLASR